VKLVMVAEEWTIANGFITPTLKIRRSVMDTHYESRYEQWLRSPDPIVWA
jgi:long-subunit acyl-CoA synthetase (AMP-forming)